MDSRFAAVSQRLHRGETVDGHELEVPLGAFAASVALRWESFARERTTAYAIIDEYHHQPYGIVNGGVWCTIAEAVASVAGFLLVAADGKIVVGINNNSDFVRSFERGRVDVEAVALQAGRTQQLWEIRIRRHDDGRLLSRSTVRLQVTDAPTVAG